MIVRNLKEMLVPLNRKFPKLVPIARSEIFHFFLLCFISLMQCKAVFHFRPDLDPWDESWYMRKEFIFPDIFFTSLNIGPLYTGWYNLIYKFAENLPQLYYLSSLIISFAIGPIFYLFLRRSRFTVLQGLSAFFLILFYPPLVTVTRFVNNFGVAFVLLGLLFVTFESRRISKLWLAAIVFFFATYVRPELSIAFLICFGVYSFYFFRKLLGRQTSWYESFKFFLLSGLLFIQILGAKTEVYVGNITHSLYIFRYYSEARKGGGPSYFNWIYGNPTTLGQAISNNPLEFLNHVAFSLKAFLPRFWDAFSSFAAHEDIGFYLILILILFLNLLSKRRIQADKTEPYWKDQILFLSLMTVPVFLSGVIFGTNTRYLIFPMICIIAFIPKILLSSEIRKSWVAAFLLLVVLIQMISPAKFNQVSYKIFQTEGIGKQSCGGVTEAITKLIKVQKQFKVDKTKAILADSLIFMYTGNNYRPNCGTIEECFSGVNDEDLTNGNIESHLLPFDAVVFDRRDNSVRLMSQKKKAWLNRFFAEPEKYGFKPLYMNCADTALLVRTSILDQR